MAIKTYGLMGIIKKGVLICFDADLTMKNGDIMGESSPRSVSVCPLTKRHEQAAISSHVQRRVSVSFRDETT